MAKYTGVTTDVTIGNGKTKVPIQGISITEIKVSTNHIINLHNMIYVSSFNVSL